MTKIDGSVFPKFMFCGLILANAISCSRSVPTAVTPKDKPKPSSSNTIVENQTETALPRGILLFDAPQFELTDQNGDAFGSQDLNGRIWIVNFMYTRCQATSHGQTARLADCRLGSANGRTVIVYDSSASPSIRNSTRLPCCVNTPRSIVLSPPVGSF